MRRENGEKIEGGARARKGSGKSSTGQPLISVITVVYNGAGSLESCIRSVLEQTCQRVEYIIIDGGSTDGTLDIIRKFDDRLDYWLSEPDSGIYDAMNKGVDAARGGWLYFLGADDRLHSAETLEQVSATLDESLDMVYGNILYSNDHIVRSKLGPGTLLHNTLHHQGAFYRAGLFRGWRYDASLKIVADYELNLKLYLDRKPVRYLDAIIARCGAGGVSRTLLMAAFHETGRIRGKYVGPLLNWLLQALFFVELQAYRLLLAAGFK